MALAMQMPNNTEKGDDTVLHDDATQCFVGV